jgi:hypothetical protein
MFHSAEHLEADLAQLQFQNQTTLVSCACDSDELGCVSRTVSMWDNMGFVDAIVNYSEGGKGSAHGANVDVAEVHGCTTVVSSQS